MKTLKIEIPNGYEIDVEKTNIADGSIVFKEIKKELPKSWEELEKLQGYYVSGNSFIREANTSNNEYARTPFATKEQAEASIPLAMYSQMLQAYKDVSIAEFIKIAEEYEPKVRPILELFFGEYAEAAFYYGLLGKLRDEYRQGWTPVWGNGIVKYGIQYNYYVIKIDLLKNANLFLSFQSEEIAEQFLENFRELIKKAKPLMS